MLDILFFFYFKGDISGVHELYSTAGNHNIIFVCHSESCILLNYDFPLENIIKTIINMKHNFTN